MADTEYPTPTTGTDDQVIVKSRTEQLIEARYGRPVPDLLRDLYQVEQLTQTEIAEKLDVSRWTVVEWMKRHRIPTVDRRASAGAEVPS